MKNRMKNPPRSFNALDVVLFVLAILGLMLATLGFSLNGEGFCL